MNSYTKLVISAILIFAAPCAGLAAPAPQPQRPGTLSQLIERAGKWVVALKVERTKDIQPPRSPMPPKPGAPGFRGAGIPKEMRSYYERPAGWTSGVLVSSEGFVLTSLYNVAGEVKAIEARLPSGRALAARIVAKSPSDDIALLRVERDPSEPPIRFDKPLWADSSTVKAGKIVFALGRSPDPDRITVTQGIISAAHRNGGRAIQTDAELDYGNVGGPLIDLDGRIVAVAAFVGHHRPQWGVNSGVGFGTSSRAILEMLGDLEQGKDHVAFRIPFLGVQAGLRKPGSRGASIQRVVKGGPADKAGFKDKDLIIEFEGVSVENFEHLRRLIFERKVGEKVKVKVKRGDKTVVLSATLTEMPKS